MAIQADTTNQYVIHSTYSPPNLFVDGHSHILKIMYDKTLNLLHINPGAAGLQGFHKERTIVRLTIEGNKMGDCEVITLSNNRNK